MRAAHWGVGIAITVVGNTLISLALNLQKLAHIRAQGDRGAGAESRAAPDERDALLQTRDEGRRSYLHSRIWWAGIALMGLGECGNFLSYGFAPASLVAPLGAVSLLANVAIAPALLNESVNATDILGILLAIAGAVAVVCCSGRSDGPLDPSELWDAVCRPVFGIYSLSMAILGTVLVVLAHSPVGERTALVNLGVCAVSGAFTVLATKGVSSFLLGARHVSQLLCEPLFFALLAVIAATAVVQLTYLNRALQHFDARLVIPTQFVLFTVSTIVGSSILYRDFAQLGALRIAGFALGCVVTFLGVYVLSVRETSAPDATDEPHTPPRPLSPVSEPVLVPRRRAHSLTVSPSAALGHARSSSRHALVAVAAIVSNPQTYLLLQEQRGSRSPSSVSAPHSPPSLARGNMSPFARNVPVVVADAAVCDGVRTAAFLGISPGRNLMLARDVSSPGRLREHLDV
ncbi:hypothetical protein MCUN1_002393 [Malassezia cuniculi]|uniref:Uncharacterized protein n=1 Tax=Malassezia cuniculi TaxID=948313 RepID=A0AAF0EVN8_9BASI|nr:hypothetical protein MCUN1_002393 [Malassezia cuniculi]